MQRTFLHPKDIKSDSIEKIVCKKMEKLRTVEMKEDTTKLLMAFLLQPDSRERSSQLLKHVWVADALIRRLKAQFNRDIDPRVAILIGFEAEAVGTCVMYVYYLEYLCKKKSITGEITLTDFCEKLFPMGLFQNDKLQEIWDSQKVSNHPDNFKDLEFEKGSDNLVDYGYAAQSLMQTEKTI